MIRRITGAIGHRQDYSGANRTGQLDDFVNFLLGRTHPLRTCEVGDRSRFAVQRKHQREMNELLRFGIERSASVNLFEIFGKVFIRSEVRRSFGKVWHGSVQTTTRSIACPRIHRGGSWAYGPHTCVRMNVVTRVAGSRQRPVPGWPERRRAVRGGSQHKSTRLQATFVHHQSGNVARTARRGQPMVVLVTGEAGVGKTDS